MHVAAVTALATAASIPEPTSPPDPAVAELLIRQANHGGTPPAGALTTVFTPPPGCFPVSTNPLEDLDLFWTSTTTCGPPNYRSYFLPFYYSPAICPSGFTIGCTRSDSDQGPPVEPTETAMMCVLRSVLPSRIPSDMPLCMFKTDIH